MDGLRSISIPLLSLLIGTPAALAQGMPKDPGDCVGAIFIKDSVLVCEHPGRGFGNILEIKENPEDDKQWLEREHHSRWYVFRAPVTTTLTFDIIPKNLDDDIDFLLFKGAVPGICEKIQTKLVVPVRSNISRNDRSHGSTCGLRKDAPDEYVRSGVGSSYSKALKVENGELLYLLVDYQDRPLDGYTIRFHYDPPPPPVVKEEKPGQKLLIDVEDAKTDKPVKASISVLGMIFDSTVVCNGKSRYALRMEPFRKLRLSCLSKGYMFYNAKVKASSDDTVRVHVRLTPIVENAHVVLDDIRFVGNDDQVLRGSRGSLLLLLRFLNENPTTKVEIQGHVNGPSYKKNKKEFIELSTARAHTVYNFLLVNDIDPARISYVGLGNSQMLYPDPKNREQSEANRRVEIRIVHT